MPLSHLADTAGIARSYLWRLLDADSSASLDTVQRLARALDVEPLVLLTSAGTLRDPSGQQSPALLTVADSTSARRRMRRRG